MALLGASVSLEQGLQASAHEGQPISGKYEAENGALQLSVYLVKPDGFFEVIIDRETGSITKAAPLNEAQSENRAMSQAKSSLDGATANAVAANSGYRAWSVVPVISDGRPVAEVTLTNGTEVKKILQKLD
jgi:hypothetical protein